MRMPISAVRRATVWVMTPKIPMAVRSNARPPNADSSHAITRVRHMASPTRSSMVLTDRSGSFGSSARTSRVMAHVMAAGAELTAHNELHPSTIGLRERQEHVGAGQRLECAVADVSDDADD